MKKTDVPVLTELKHSGADRWCTGQSGEHSAVTAWRWTGCCWSSMGGRECPKRVEKRILKVNIKSCRDGEVAGREAGGVTEAEQKSASQDRGSDQLILLSCKPRSFSRFPLEIFGPRSYFCVNSMHVFLF